MLFSLWWLIRDLTIPLSIGTQFFKNSGIKNAFIISMVTSSVNTVSTLPGLYAIDKWGRRPLLFWGAIGMCVSQFIVAVLGTTTTGQDSEGNIIVKNLAAQKASISFVCIYIFFFASTWGPIAWYVCSTRSKSLFYPLRMFLFAFKTALRHNTYSSW